jgi:hypothetical protein
MIRDYFQQSSIGFLIKIIHIESLGGIGVNEKDISFQKKPEALFP